MKTATRLNHLPLAGYPIISISADAAGQLIASRLTEAKATALLFANTNFILKCRHLVPWMNTEKVVLLNDGIGLDITAQIIHGQKYIDNLGGTDFLPLLLKSYLYGHKVFLLGGKPGVAEAAAKVIDQLGVTVTGCADGYSGKDALDLHHTINASNADIVLVAMGNSMQEDWICRNMDLIKPKLFIGVGALLDFLAGNVPRAPKWIRTIRFEWLYRLYREPRRLAKRYTVDIFSFLYLCSSYQKQNQR